MHLLSALAPVLAPFHLFVYSALLGTQLYQSFVLVKVAHRALPPEAFPLLQKRVFPVYFRGQWLLLILTAITLPPRGPLSLVREKQDWIALLVAGVTASLNLMLFGPRTNRLMMSRRYQAETDARQLANGVVSTEMKSLNRMFSRNHAMCIHLNLVTIGATLWYGWRLASKLTFKAD